MKNKFKKRISEVNNKGISLIVLVLTIIIALILLTTIVITTKNTIDNTNITTFAKDLNEVRQATENYYIENNLIPSVEDSTIMSKDELLGISSSPSVLVEELTENNDLTSQFYTIDFAKINVTKSAYGTKKFGESDIFVIAYPSMNVYYPYGLEAKGTVYFSITSKISKLTTISQNQVGSYLTSVISSNGIKVTKANGWTNKMNVNIEVEMGVGESLYMSVSGDTNRLITTITGKNVFGFNLLSSIVSDIETIKIPTLTLAEANYIELGTKPVSDRYVNILKYKDSEIIGQVRIDLSNFSNDLPTITNVTLLSYLKVNTAQLTLTNSDSGIKEVRYEYLTKFSENGTIVNYYNGISDFDSSYMRNNSKKAQIGSDLTTTINAPKNVQSVKIALIDKSGNINSYNKDIAPGLYIGYTLDNYTSTSLQLTANMYSINGIKSIIFSKSLDGTNFTDEQLYTLNNTTSGVITQQSSPYTDFSQDNVYIKMVAVNYDSTIIETRIVQINLNEQQAYQEPETELGQAEIGVIVQENSTINGLAPAYNNPIIPKGFKAINDGAVWPTDWDTGLVIEDINGNQFVWVPVDGTAVQYAKWCTLGVAWNSSLVVDYGLPQGIVEADQISNYGGFYIGRYEAMFDYNGGDIRVASKRSTSTYNWTWLRDEAHTGYLWNFVDYADSQFYSQNMAASYGYDTSRVITNLVTGTQWDTVMKWIQNSGKSVIDTRAWGNYTNSVAPANVTGFGSLNISGFSEYWKAKNIYDLAGNSWEWINEKYSNTGFIYRGGSTQSDGLASPASYRNANVETTMSIVLTFRVALYIK